MGAHQSNTTPAPTIWEVPDDVWPVIPQLLAAHDPAKAKGHRRVNLRRVLHGIIVRRRTGCQWHRVPAAFGDDSTVHRPCQQWGQHGLVARLWAVAGGAWRHPRRRRVAVARGRHRQGQGPHRGRPGRPPSHRPRATGVKRSLVVEADGGPRGAALAGANGHDTKRLATPL
jgi:putative transposase